jgi:hypothetical protein
LNGMTEHVHFVPVEGAGMIVLVDGQTKKWKNWKEVDDMA